MADPQTWWKAALSTFLEFLRALIASNRAAAAADKNLEKANEAERRVDAAGDAERERLRSKWTRPSS